MNSQQLKELEDQLWSAADNLRANSDLKASEYGTPVLGLIFLKFADINYRRYEKEIKAEFDTLKETRREKPLHEIAVAKCGFYLPDHARYTYLLNLSENQDIAKAIETAMESIEEYKPELQGSLPKDEYYRLTRTEQMKTLPFDCSGSSTTSRMMPPAMCSVRSTNTSSVSLHLQKAKAAASSLHRGRSFASW